MSTADARVSAARAQALAAAASANGGEAPRGSLARRRQRARKRADAAINRTSGPSWVPFAIGGGIDLVALALVGFGVASPMSYLAAAAIHIVAVYVIIRFDDQLVGSRRGLAAALSLAMPVAGAGLVAVALATRPQAGLTAAIPVDHVESPTLDAACFQKIALALSPCEVLSAPGHEAGSATLAALIRRGDAASVRLLRWLIIANPQMAVDAALALEELSTRFEVGLETRRRDLALAPSAASALEAGTFISRAMQSGLVDPLMLTARATEARRCFALARDLDPTRDDDDVMLAWGQMELAAMHPETALLMAEQVLARQADGRGRVALVALRDEARFASHQRPGRDLGPGSFAAPVLLAA